MNAIFIGSFVLFCYYVPRQVLFDFLDVPLVYKHGDFEAARHLFLLIFNAVVFDNIATICRFNNFPALFCTGVPHSIAGNAVSSPLYGKV
jgi:hypothetical protein